MIRHFVAHYHVERNHQGLENRLIMRAKTAVAKSGRVQTHHRLGGMLNYYTARPHDSSFWTIRGARIFRPDCLLEQQKLGRRGSFAGSRFAPMVPFCATAYMRLRA